MLNNFNRITKIYSIERFFFSLNEVLMVEFWTGFCLLFIYPDKKDVYTQRRHSREVLFMFPRSAGGDFVLVYVIYSYLVGIDNYFLMFQVYFRQVYLTGILYALFSMICSFHPFHITSWGDVIWTNDIKIRRCDWLLRDCEAYSIKSDR